MAAFLTPDAQEGLLQLQHVLSLSWHPEAVPAAWLTYQFGHKVPCGLQEARVGVRDFPK